MFSRDWPWCIRSVVSGIAIAIGIVFASILAVVKTMRMVIVTVAAPLVSSSCCFIFCTSSFVISFLAWSLWALLSPLSLLSPSALICGFAGVVVIAIVISANASLTFLVPLSCRRFVFFCLGVWFGRACKVGSVRAVSARPPRENRG